ncbi:MAG: fructosamine kinase family protein [Chitinophagaceae bacterium]
MSVSANTIEKILKSILGFNINIQQQAGGCISNCYLVKTHDKKFFCKINSATKFPHLFEQEAKGLNLLGTSYKIKTPEIIDIYYEDDYQILLLEWIEEGERTTTFWKKFGSQLAELHSVTKDQFGLNINNYMGSVLQINEQTSDWNIFFIEQRLKPLVKACKQKGLLTAFHEQVFSTLYTQLPPFFKDVRPALVHGDLWNGNFMCNKNEEPVLIDPAAYYGIPAVDLGMTKLFGGFSRSFHEAYQYHSALSKNQDQQNKICNLYPLLIHLLLFGKSYLPQIEETIKDFK